jgi:hypothetical protein
MTVKGAKQEEIGAAFAIMRGIDRIGIDLACIMVATRSQRISLADVQTMWSRPYFVPDHWMRQVVTYRLPLLDDAALMWVLQTEADKLAGTVQEFPERAELYSVLAALAAIHGRHESAKSYVTAASDNLIAYGNHKDMLFFQIVDIATACNHAGIHGPLDWLLRLAPAIAAISQFTDGDETGYLPERLSDALAVISPSHLLRYHRWLCRVEEYSDALHAFHVFLRVADLSEPINQAIAATAIDDRSRSIIAERQANGDSGASTVESSLECYLGPFRPTSDKEQSSADRGMSESKELVDPDQYPPKRFRDYLASIEGRYFTHEIDIAAWAEHWKGKGQVKHVIEALTGEIERGAYLRCHDLVFTLVCEAYGKDQAYMWLVNAQRENHGWSTYFTAKEEAIKRWEIVRSQYSTKWLQFLMDSLGPRSDQSPNAFVVSSVGVLRVVEYLIHVDQLAQARELAEHLVTVSLELTVPVTLPIPDWAVAP